MKQGKKKEKEKKLVFFFVYLMMISKGSPKHEAVSCCKERNGSRHSVLQFPCKIKLWEGGLLAVIWCIVPHLPLLLLAKKLENTSA
jgi:hypothetical protein